MDTNMEIDGKVATSDAQLNQTPATVSASSSSNIRQKTSSSHTRKNSHRLKKTKTNGHLAQQQLKKFLQRSPGFAQLEFFRQLCAVSGGTPGGLSAAPAIDIDTLSGASHLPSQLPGYLRKAMVTHCH
eukprot:comp22364_c1_seq1/m.33328 comp22364_c1_seq1/g.33328  ORF comp22364_c1_seq1/g.33328 comp22364_c1_seq1/m.33328 type:complete len:128 (-) comp22364_c1_seq1:678-1061(-)